jgi:DNA-binding XRE family transcriptional regulator
VLAQMVHEQGGSGNRPEDPGNVAGRAPETGRGLGVERHAHVVCGGPSAKVEPLCVAWTCSERPIPPAAGPAELCQEDNCDHPQCRAYDERMERLTAEQERMIKRNARRSIRRWFQEYELPSMARQHHAVMSLARAHSTVRARGTTRAPSRRRTRTTCASRDDSSSGEDPPHPLALPRARSYGSRVLPHARAPDFSPLLLAICKSWNEGRLEMGEWQTRESYSFGRMLTAMRLNKGLRQEDLGELIGVSGTTIGRWERNEARPDVSVVMDLAEALEAPAYKLLAKWQVGRG